MRLCGEIERFRSLRCGYAYVDLRISGAEGPGERCSVLVPALVLIRDGFPGIDDVVEVEAHPTAGDAPVAVPDQVRCCAHWLSIRTGLLGPGRRWWAGRHVRRFCGGQ